MRPSLRKDGPAAEIAENREEAAVVAAAATAGSFLTL